MTKFSHPDCAYLSALIYRDRARFERDVTLRGWRVERWWDHRGSQGSLVHAERASALVFRGTEASRVKIRDLFSNLTWPWPTAWQGPGGAHAGYRRHFNMIAGEALTAAERVASARPLTVTGHSMGGALATLFAAWYGWRWPHYRLAELVTFGAPKAIDLMATSGIRCPVARYAIDGDFAPWWPPAVGLAHPEPAIPMDAPAGYRGPLGRHDVEAYIIAVEGRP